MGLYLCPYAVDLDKVKATFNSKDEKLFCELKNTFSYETSSEDVKNALREILFGEDKVQSYTPVYGYALIILINHFGTNLCPEGDIFKLGTSTEIIDNIFREYNINFSLDELSELIYEFDIPYDFSWNPTIGGISKDRLEWLLPKLEKIEISAHNLPRPRCPITALQAIYIVKRAAKFCLDKQLDWITYIP